MKKSTRKKNGSVAAAFFVLLSALALLGVRWMLATWPHLKMDELIYHITAPVNGVDKELVISGVVTCILPALAIFALSLILFRFIRRRGLLLLCTAVVLLLSLTAALWQMDQKVQLISWLRAQGENSDFIAENYADPREVSITFPDGKRNLVYIFLESVETSFADKASGGGRDVSVIPRLTELALHNEDFSGDREVLNGGHTLSGSTWTMGAMFAHTAGLPLKVSVEGNAMGKQEHFFPGIDVLGDVLADAGYNQTLLIGSKAEFGGRDLYFADHGNYALHDYIYAQETGLIDKKYHVFWGYEDEKLFAFARDELLQLSSQDAPFNLTLLTVDSHFEDGYLCARCESTFEDQYANVLLCADCQVTEFLAWMQQQPFYENTAVVIVGDHLTMDSDFGNSIEWDYDRRVYTAFVNAACETEDPTLWREYSTYDMFPTTLAAMGAKIEGNRLALGVNLFSAELTIIEKYGMDTVGAELSKNSLFMQEKAQLFVMELRNYDYTGNTLDFYAEGLDLVDERYVEVELTTGGQTHLLFRERTDGKRIVEATLQLPENISGDAKTAVYWVDKEGVRTLGGGFDGHPLSLITSTLTYLDTLAQLKNTSVLMAVKDEAAQSITPQIVEKMKNLGLATDLTGQIRASYCAVITAEGVNEELSYAPIKMNDKLPDGVKYRLMSAGFDAGNRVSIKIDGDEYAVEKRGINVVVYDHTTQTVIDSITIDTHSECNIKRAEKE